MVASIKKRLDKIKENRLYDLLIQLFPKYLRWFGYSHSILDGVYLSQWGGIIELATNKGKLQVWSYAANIFPIEKGIQWSKS